MTHIGRASQIFTFPNVSAHESKNHEHFITTGSVFRATLPTIDSIPGQERERQLELTEAPPPRYNQSCFCSSAVVSGKCVGLISDLVPN